MNLNCVICADLLSASQEVYVTLCGHIFHDGCLFQWLERSRSCPQCRAKCGRRDVHRVYFNIANLDTSNIDVASVQQQLDDMKLQMIEKERALNKASEEIETLKAARKKCMKTVSGLERELSKQQFLMFSYNEQIKRLETDNKAIEELRKENQALKSKNNLMTTIQDVLTSSHTEVENMLKEKQDPNTLCVLLVTLKRELRLCENKRNELRNDLKAAQKDLRNEQKLKESLQEKISYLESANYRLEEAVKSLKAAEHVDLTENEPPLSSSMTLSPAFRAKLVHIEREKKTMFSSSPNISERIKIIEESNSPYFNIKSSSIGLANLLKASDNIRNKDPPSHKETTVGILRKTSSDVSEKYSIFKKPRLEVQLNQLNPHPSHMVFNGMGGSEKKDDFSDFMKRKPICEMKMKTTLSDRLKGGKLKRLPTAQPAEKKP